MMSIPALMKRERLMIIARGIPAPVLVQAASACADAGIVLLESTFDHTLPDPIRDNAEKLRALERTLGGRIRFGAGTVLTAEEVRAAADAGAEYIVCPHTDEAVIAEAKRLGLAVVPGALTPTEIVRAWNLGADLVKLFPADALGPKYIKSLQPPLGHIPLLAACGMTAQTIPDYLRAGITVAAVGTSILQKELLAREDYNGIAAAAREHLAAVRSV